MMEGAGESEKGRTRHGGGGLLTEEAMKHTER